MSPAAVTQAAVILAAGNGTRYTGSGGTDHKLLADLHGRPVVARAIGHALDAIGPGLDEVIVVAGAVDVPAPEGVLTVHNPHWPAGMATSLQAAVQIAAGRGHGAVVVGLGDQPGIAPEAWRRVALSPAPVATATYDGGRGHPVRLAAEIWPLLPTSGDTGARPLMISRPELVAEIACPGSPIDIDTVEDLLQWS